MPALPVENMALNLIADELQQTYARYRRLGDEGDNAKERFQALKAELLERITAMDL